MPVLGLDCEWLRFAPNQNLNSSQVFAEIGWTVGCAISKLTYNNANYYSFRLMISFGLVGAGLKGGGVFFTLNDSAAHSTGSEDGDVYFVYGVGGFGTCAE